MIVEKGEDALLLAPTVIDARSSLLRLPLHKGYQAALKKPLTDCVGIVCVSLDGDSGSGPS
jgi:hypothetical protein